MQVSLLTQRIRLACLSAAMLGLMGCTATSPSNSVSTATPDNTSYSTTFPELYGTKEAFAKEAMYFVVTDRYVDGDPTNNQVNQGGDYPTFNLELVGENGATANVGYMGGDFQGVLNNIDYITDMGFSAIWLTPVLDNPDQAFAGGEVIEYGGAFKDGGKTGYHGYWATNFYKEDEHLISPGLDYRAFTQALAKHDVKAVLDIVANHGSPSFTMPIDQPGFGELYDAQGTLVADHQNLATEALSSDNPLHGFFHQYPDIMQLSNLDETNPAVQDYLINSYLYWIEQGASAFRIDTIKHVPHRFWKIMADRIREQHPDFFMFAESYDYNANFIAQHTLPKNGQISVLDFPGQQAITQVFEDPESDFAQLNDYLHLTHGPYHNVYDLTTFYDNHDMRRMNASDEGFIDAHNWLFTTRGIPVIYQGSEFGFMRGTAEHAGNRNFIGQETIMQNANHPIREGLIEIANIRKQLPTLQQGLQITHELKGDKASFYRVIQTAETQQIALVLLNKSNQVQPFVIDEMVQAGSWEEQLSGATLKVKDEIRTQVEPHGVQVWVLNESVTQPELLQAAQHAMQYK
ncbi:MAG: alpha-amylase family glycosyl hydrolase [Glaciecola sp.]|nr:alpha-amylase family glycosyl hydrolase [Glaciecola sp.]MDG2100406.1 alpha-amylase family glycosyl hydrolase [Glaciecola sp.]